ncbi:hypothetical protein BJ741DRAFT_652126 [Chytriomyces cf. hyalinus JEL632]|nr:hypothetical protein BJ741DRAFT_652126 [Chytriomyces cf. hyalinus JEL632]
MSFKHCPSKIEMGQEQPQPTMKQRGSHPLSRLLLAAGAALVLVAATLGLDRTRFLAFHAHLRTAFPLVHARMDLRVINEYSLLYTWKGSDEGAAPMVLMVSGLMNHSLGSLTKRTAWFGDGDPATPSRRFLEHSKRPKDFLAQVLLLNPAFGHDEEISGYQGARKIAEYMVKELGLTGKIGLLIDEGTSFDEFEGVPMANVTVAEKGYVDVSLTVETKGGHSSVPPKHTGIGLTALLMSALEAHPYPVSIPDSNPILGLVRCYAEHSPKPKKFFKWAVNHLPESRSKLAEKVASISPSFEALLGTTQATDIIFGGLKINALPEKVTTVINHRIAVDSSLAEVQAHLTSILKPVAIKNGLDFVIHDFISESVGILPSLDSLGTVTVRTNSGVGLEPSPMSPSVGSGERAWNVLEGSIRHAYEAACDNLIVTPSMMAGNTDTRHYWNLTKNIYRFGPGRGANVHTVYEYVAIDGYLDGIKFYEALIRNWNSE